MGDTRGRNSIAVKRPGPWLYVTEDVTRHVALLRGDGAADVVQVLGSMDGAYEPMVPLYSRTMRGYVIPLRFVPDVEAYCQNAHQLCVVSERKAKP